MVAVLLNVEEYESLTMPDLLELPLEEVNPKIRTAGQKAKKCQSLNIEYLKCQDRKESTKKNKSYPIWLNAVSSLNTKKLKDICWKAELLRCDSKREIQKAAGSGILE